MDEHERRSDGKFALNLLHRPPGLSEGGNSTIKRKGKAIPVVLPCVGERFEFVVQRYSVGPSEGSHGEDAFTHLHFTVGDAPDESTRERCFWYRALKAYWLETALSIDRCSSQSSEAQNNKAQLAINGMIGLGLKRSGSELVWDRYGIKDEKRLDREQHADGYAYIGAEGDGTNDSAAGIPTEDFVKFAETVLTRSSGRADEREIKRKYAAEFLPRTLDKCWAMQAAALVPDEKSADGHPAYVEMAKQHGDHFVQRCKNIANRHTGDGNKDFDLFLESVGEWRNTRQRKADELERKLWHLFQWDIDYAILNAYSHIAKSLMEIPDVKKLLDGRSSSYNYFAHTFQRPLLYHVPALHPFWNLCLGSWPRAKVVADAASDIITPKGETLKTGKSKEAAERLNGLFVAALVIYDRLVTERPMQKSTVLGNDPLFEDGGKRGEDAAESNEGGADDDDEKILPVEKKRSGSTRSEFIPVDKHKSFSSEAARVLEEEDETPGSRLSKPRNTGDGGWVYAGDESNIPDPEAKAPGESSLKAEFIETIEEMKAGGGRDVLIAIDRHFHTMTIEECAAKYVCSGGTITKRAKKCLSIMKRELERRNLSLQALL